MVAENDRLSDLAQDAAGRGVQNADKDQVLLTPKADRRKHRIPAPDCPCCGWDDEVSLARDGGSLTWRTGRVGEPVVAAGPTAVCVRRGNGTSCQEFQGSRFDANRNHSVGRGRKNLVIHMDIRCALKRHLSGALRCQRRRVVASLE